VGAQSWVAEQHHAESIEIGRKLLEKEAGRFQLSIKKMLSDNNGNLKRIANEYVYDRTDDLLAVIGYGKTAYHVIAKYLGPGKFEALDNQNESRLRNGVRAVQERSAVDG
jgi:GTP pyrophosphokinase